MRLLIAPTSTAIGLSILLMLWGHSECRHAQATSMQAGISMAESLLGALSGSLQSSLRRGRGYSERINTILENTLESTRLQHILILQDQRELSQAGTLTPDPPQTADGNRLEGSTLWIWRTIQLQDHAPNAPSLGAGFGRGRIDTEADLNLADQQQLILLGLDATPLYQRIQTEKQRIQLTASTAIAAVLVFTAAWIFMLRNRKLTVELDRESLRAAHLSDLQLSGAGLAHETKNPLGLIRGLAQQINRNQEAPPLIRHIASDIMEQADIATARLGEFLAFSKRHSPHLQPVDLSEVVKKICSLMQYDAEQNHITLENHIHPGSILADEQMLTQVIINLLTNALKACRAGDHVSLRSTNEHTPTRRLTISDTGCGIPDKLQLDMFKPYVTGRADGHGLGLAIVRRIVEDHGWTLALQSAEGEGTTLTISGLTCHQKELP